jgi:polyhydroxybutyrate depolymerase
MTLTRLTRRTVPLPCLIAAVIAALLALAACGPQDSSSSSATGTTGASGTTATAQAGIPVGRSTQTMTIGGAQRTVHLYRPAGLSGPVPLVVMLHGGYGNGVQAEDSYHWDPEADTGHFLLALPDGLNASWNGGGGCCGKSARQNVDDVTFLTQMVTMLRGEISVDPHRIFIAGVSNGGIMAYRMACQTDIFAAVGADSTTMLVPCHPAKPVSVLHIHGTADPIIPYKGGTGEAYGLRGAAITTPPIPSVIADWRAIDHCPAPAVSTSGVLTTSIANCPGGTTVEFITIAGAGHQWPGGDPNRKEEIIFHTGAPSTAINATQAFWQFFAAHPGS